MKSILKSNLFRESFILYPPVGIPIALENPIVRKTLIFLDQTFLQLIGPKNCINGISINRSRNLGNGV